MSDPLKWPPDQQPTDPGPPQPLGSGALLLCGIFLLLGIGILGYAVYRTIPSVRLAVSGARTDGRVIRNERGIFPVVEFEVNGQQIVVGANSGTEPPEFHEGDAVTVLYDRMHPDYAIIQSFGQMWTTPLFLLAAGMFFTAMPVLGARRKYGAMLLLISLVPGVSVLCPAISGVVDTAHLAIVGTRVNATVIELYHEDGEDYPVLAFPTANGQQVRFTADDKGLPQGDIVPVIYDPKHPRDSSIRSFRQMWLEPLLACAGGILFTAIPLLLGGTGLWSRLGQGPITWPPPRRPSPVEGSPPS